MSAINIIYPLALTHLFVFILFKVQLIKKRLWCRKLILGRDISPGM